MELIVKNDPAPTFTTGAIECVSIDRATAMRANYKDDANAFDWLIKVLHAAVKFKLPDGGRLIGKYQGTEHLTELLRLPFSEVALEYTMTGAAQEGLISCSKRIALCLSSESQFITSNILGCLPNDGRDGIFVIPIFQQDSDKSWIYPTSGGFLERGCSVSHEPTSKAYLDQLRLKGFTEEDIAKNDGYQIQLFHFLPSFLKTLTSLPKDRQEEVEAAISANLNEELSAAIDFCAVINCSNVKTELVPPSLKLNKKRLSNDKPPMFEYRVLVLESDGEGILSTDKSINAGLYGSRTTPRLHLRRGHIRRLKSKTIWINQMMVGDPANGAIAKEYKIVSKKN